MAPLRLISYNCKNFSGCHSDLKKSFISRLFNNCDILLLQEHWLYMSQFHLLDDISDKSVMYHGVSAMDSEVFRQGRPHGGCVIVWRSDLKYKICKIDVMSRRLACVSIVIDGGTKFLLFNVYMPNDDKSDGDNLAEYQDILAEITSVCNHENAQFIIAAGDFNTDISRKSVFVDELTRFCNAECMTSCATLDVSSVEYTFESMSNHSRSLIDHVLISNSCIDAVESHCTIDGIDNASDHIAIMTQLNINCGYFKNMPSNHVPKTTWYKASMGDIKMYKEELDKLLSNIYVSQDCIDCRNVWCNDHVQVIEHLYKDIVSACMTASKVIPSTGKSSNRKVIPGWKEYCETQRKVALYWHNAWKSEGRPRHGFLASTRRKYRLKYHQTVKMVKKRENVIRCEKMAHSIIADNGRHFWREARAMRGKGCRKLPQSVDNQNGGKAVANLFADKFCNIFNSIGYDKNEMDNIMADCNELLMQSSEKDISKCLVTELEIVTIIKNLKKGKSDGNIGLFSDHIIQGTPKLFGLLKILINLMIIHGISPKDLLIGTIIPIPKNKRVNVSNSDNFRGICLQSVICKVIDLVMLCKDEQCLQTSELQFGFKEGVSAASAAAIVHETLDYYINGKGSVYVLALDATKAFDRVEYSKLFKLLLKRKVNPLFIRLLYSMYINQRLCVSYNNSCSEYFNVSNGVKQGGVLSPTLFTCYMDGAIQKLSKSNDGCHIGDCYTGCIAYADDVILLSPSVNALHNQVQIIEEFAYEHSITFNGSKSKLMCVSTKTSDSNIIIEVCNQSVPCVDSINYLGHIISCNRKDSHVESVKRDFIGKFNSVLADFSNVNSQLKQQLIEKYCYSLYGSHFCDYSNNEMKKVCTMWRKSIRRTWSLPSRTHSSLLPFISDCTPIDIVIHRRFYRFFLKSLESDNNVISTIFENAIGTQSRLGRNYKYVSRRYSSLGIVNFTSWLDAYHELDIVYAEIVRDLINIRDGHHQKACFNRNECNALIEYICTMP